MSSETFSAPGASNQTDVFAVHGADPEVLAFAMAKYSRSALSMRESLTEISAQRAEQFLNTFYFQYGHRSIADLAHIAFAVERLSLLAAIVLVDEQRWDGQERSTRYQNFLKSGWYFPDFGEDTGAAQLYSGTVENLFAAYQRTTAAVLDLLRRSIACPESLKPEAYERTLKARAFDVARYLLPLATNTSLGQIVSARTLETQVSRLLSHPAAEVRDLGIEAARSGHRPGLERERASRRAFLRKDRRSRPGPGRRSRQLLTREVRTAPTLVKYAQPNDYEIQTRAELAQAAAEILKGLPIAAAPLVDLVERTETPGSGTGGHAALLRQPPPLPPDSRPGGRFQPRTCVGDCRAGPAPPRPARRGAARLSCRSGAAVRHPDGHWRLPRHAPPSPLHADHPALHHAARLRDPDSGDLAGDADMLAEAGVLADYQAADRAAHAASARIAASDAPEAAQSALYLLPLATRIRSLFKMDFAEAQYISELRSGPAGHFSYRRVAWEMFLALQRQHPTLAKHIRVTDFTQPIDLLQR